MKNRVLTLAVTAGVLFGLSASASAQGAGATTTMPTFELGAGYQMLSAGEVCTDDPLVETCVPNRTFPFGLAIDATRNFGALSIVGEGGWSFDSDETQGTDIKFNNWHLAGGGRWTSRKSRLWPYAQVLAGVVQDRLSSDNDVFSNSQTSFMLQPGAGVTWLAGDGWGVFGQVDYRRVFLDETENFSGGRNDFRVFVGLRMILD